MHPSSQDTEDARRLQWGSSPRWRLSLVLLQAGRLRRRRPPAGGGGGLFLPPSRRPGRQEVSARPARCGEPGSWEQPQLDWRRTAGSGRRGVEGWIPSLGSPFVPRRPGLPSQVPLPPILPTHPVGGLAVSQLCTSPLSAHGALGPGRGEGPFSSPWGPPGPSRVRVGEGDNP